MDSHLSLSRRERQIMDVIFGLGKATVTEVWESLPDRPSRTAVRTLLRILEDKGHLKHTKKGREFVYEPVQLRVPAGQSALQRVLKTFFDGSLEKAVAAHLSDPRAELSPDDLKRLARLIRQAEREESSR